MNVFAVFRALWRHRALTVITVGTCLAIAAAVIQFATPIYRATALVIASTDLVASGGSTQEAREEFLNSQAEFITTEDVIKAAIRSIGPDTLLASESETRTLDWLPPRMQRLAEHVRTLDWLPPRLQRIVEQMRSRFLISNGSTDQGDRVISKAESEQEAYRLAFNSLQVAIKPRTSVISVTVRHSNPETAARFANDIVDQYLHKQMLIYNQPASLRFLNEETARYENELQRAAAAFDAFAKENGIYEIDEQKRLALSRRSTADASAEETRAKIVQKEAEINSMVHNLTKLKSVAFSRSMSSLIGEIGKSALPNSSPEKVAPPSDLSKDPPLLVIKVYQEEMQNLVSAVAALNGLRARLIPEEEERSKIDESLRKLSQLAGQFTALSINLEMARRNTVLFSQKSTEQQLSADTEKQRIARVRIMQDATIPFEPSFPRPAVVSVAGLVIGLVAAIVFALALESTARAQPARSSTEAPPLPEIGTAQNSVGLQMPAARVHHFIQDVPSPNKRGVPSHDLAEIRRDQVTTVERQPAERQPSL